MVMDISKHNVKDLATLVSLFMTANQLRSAQLCVNEIQRRLTLAKEFTQISAGERLAALTEANLLMGACESSSELPFEKIETAPRIEVAASLEDIEDLARLQPNPQVADIVIAAMAAEPEPGMIRDEDGKVTHISVQPGKKGYDPEIHENTALKIFCDGSHIENAHTADTVAGTAWYYKKNEQGRIKTLEVHGKVEIRGVD